MVGAEVCPTRVVQTSPRAMPATKRQRAQAAGTGGYSQPRSSATRTASTRLRVTVFAIAADR
jgi:hypothetical protein